MAMDLHPTLGDILDDFLYCEMVRVLIKPRSWRLQ